MFALQFVLPFRFRLVPPLLVIAAVGAIGRPAATEETDWADQVHAARCPEWAKETLPEAMLPFLGKRGLPNPWPQFKGPLGKSVAGIDRWQANMFVVCRDETSRFLYESYTPLKVPYRPGSLPAHERLAATYTTGLKTDTEKAVALLTNALVREFRHPTMPPLGAPCRADRALLDEDLLRTGTGFCNEQARVFVRLCQVQGIPARIVHLFYADGRTGHTIAEFYADGRFCMADSSWYCVFPGRDGRLMNAAECHEEANRETVGAVYFARMQQLSQMPDEELVGRQYPGAGEDPARQQKVAAAANSRRENLRKKTAKELGEQLWRFGIINYPLPKQ